MKKLMIAACAVAMTLGLTSCGGGSVTGAIYADYTKPYQVTSNNLGSKVGEAVNVSYVAVYAGGDASVETAAKKAGISKISHVDLKIYNILGCYTTNTYYVYGE